MSSKLSGRVEDCCEAARGVVDRALAALRTEHIDVYMVHHPENMLNDERCS